MPKKKLTIPKEPMSVGFAVFNGHVNDADRYVRQLMAKVCPDYLKRLEKIEKKHNGIMGIFNQKPNPATSFYAAAVCAIVNAKIGAI